MTLMTKAIALHLYGPAQQHRIVSNINPQEMQALVLQRFTKLLPAEHTSLVETKYKFQIHENVLMYLNLYLVATRSNECKATSGFMRGILPYLSSCNSFLIFSSRLEKSIGTKR